MMRKGHISGWSFTGNACPSGSGEDLRNSEKGGKDTDFNSLSAQRHMGAIATGYPNLISSEGIEPGIKIGGRGEVAVPKQRRLPMKGKIESPSHPREWLQKVSKQARLAFERRNPPKAIKTLRHRVVQPRPGGILSPVSGIDKQHKG